MKTEDIVTRILDERYAVPEDDRIGPLLRNMVSEIVERALQLSVEPEPIPHVPSDREVALADPEYWIAEARHLTAMEDEGRHTDYHDARMLSFVLLSLIDEAGE